GTTAENPWTIGSWSLTRPPALRRPASTVRSCPGTVRTMTEANRERGRSAEAPGATRKTETAAASVIAPAIRQRHRRLSSGRDQLTPHVVPHRGGADIAR